MAEELRASCRRQGIPVLPGSGAPGKVSGSYFGNNSQSEGGASAWSWLRDKAREIIEDDKWKAARDAAKVLAAASAAAGIGYLGYRNWNGVPNIVGAKPAPGSRTYQLKTPNAPATAPSTSHINDALLRTLRRDLAELDPGDPDYIMKHSNLTLQIARMGRGKLPEPLADKPWLI
jgi:hypothetical protein